MIERVRGPYKYLAHPDWDASQLLHGFIGVTGDFQDACFGKEAERFCREFRFEELFVLRQVHGNSIVEFLPGKEPWTEGDAIISTLEHLQGRAIGIRTADCVPLLLREGTRVALIHAGWRGLANRIIAKTLAYFEGTSLQVLIGPCAGDFYEVGPEVIEAFGSVSPVALNKGDKYHLSVAKTAAQEVLCIFPHGQIFSSNYCTLSESAYFSHRRQKGSAGRNLSFIGIPTL